MENKSSLEQPPISNRICVYATAIYVRQRLKICTKCTTFWSSLANPAVFIIECGFVNGSVSGDGTIDKTIF